MIFNSVEFLIFLPIVFLLWWKFFRTRQAQNIFIIFASYVFYGWWDVRFLALIFITSICSYASGLLIERNQRHAKAWMIGNISINLLILAFFKYYNFFIENFQVLLSEVGMHADFPTLKIILPVGISFYTFQALSYTIDVYKGKIGATRDIFAFMAYISFFPQLVAGPIERATNLLPQFLRERRFDYGIAVDGCRQMLWGFFKKIVIADNCATVVDVVFNNAAEAGFGYLLLGAVFFSFQIYGDFSGYSSIAIGCAKLFGIHLKPNFLTPYFSRDCAEFWRRWHISLNKWFVDYVYIPLGGSRVSRSLIVRNIFVIFLLSGLWHGANWTYISWGAYHAFLFLPLILSGKNRKYIPRSDDRDLRLPTLRETLQILSTFLLVTLGWILFRAKTLTDAIDYLYGIISIRTGGTLHIHFREYKFLVFMIPIMLIVEWINRNGESDFYRLPSGKYLRFLIYMLLVGIIYIAYMMSIENDSTFIYFQF